VNDTELRRKAVELAQYVNKQTPENVGYVLILHDFSGEGNVSTVIRSNFATDSIPNAMAASALDEAVGKGDVDQIGQDPTDQPPRRERR
jgi:hypothetical protein